ncbi:orc1/cdc6 family replication initiation protein [Halomarina pelagica]|uniref:orc1/cdc6 family replication initiation protein n=1 Tax=Halomarina pelagica TaxID=2961599 RepID=UPI0020C32A07|nr:orc1/cdc6 family replication initiation protein [Halomarina sp. BND7]
MAGDPLDPEKLFSVQDEIFANRRLLETSHVPEPGRIVGRDMEITTLAGHLEDALLCSSPENVIVYGKTGTGKSLVSRWVSQRIQESAPKDVTIRATRIDCSQDTTETQVASSLARTFNDPVVTGSTVPLTGLSASNYWKLLWEALDEQYDVAIVILDEADLLSTHNPLMRLSRARENADTNARIGVIAVSNKLQYPSRLDERTVSSLRAKELPFPPYDADQLTEILERRREAFRDGVLSEDVIPLCSAFAAQEHGDARKAIDILRHAGKLAHKEGIDRVVERHVREARRLAERDRFTETTRTATMQAKAGLLALAALSLRHDRSVFTTSEIYDQYFAIAREIDLDPLSVRRFRDILKEQAFLGLLESEKENDGKGGGIHIDHRLMDDPELVYDTLSEDERLGESTLTIDSESV